MTKFVGTAADDMIVGTDSADRIEGRDGDDRLSGLNGNDILDGGAGADILSGDRGNDQLLGGAGDDILQGGVGNDLIAGGLGDDVFSGGEGQESAPEISIRGGDLADFRASETAIHVDLSLTTAQNTGEGMDRFLDIEGIFASAFDDTLRGSADVDTLLGGDGSDLLFGGDGGDWLYGGGADLSINGDTGTNSLFGEGGDDRLTTGTGRDNLDGGDGNDTIVTMHRSTSDFSAAGTIDGGAGDDRVLVDDQRLHQILQGGSGTDTLLVGDFSLEGFSSANGFEYFDAGPNSAIRGTTSDNVFDFRDIIVEHKTANPLDGGYMICFGRAGNDIIYAPRDSGSSLFGDGYFSTDSGDDILYGGNADDSLDGGGGSDRLIGGAGDDYISGGYDPAGGFDDVDVLDGGAGNDHLIAGMYGTSALLGGDGDDVVELVGIIGKLSGGSGIDTLLVAGGAVPVMHRFDASAGFELWSSEGGGGIRGTEAGDLLDFSGLRAEASVAELIVQSSLGNDVILGLQGAKNTLAGEEGNDRLTGGDQGDRLIGGLGSDYLNGLQGDDTLIGNTGNDTYVIDSTRDIVEELEGEGIDTILSRVTHTLETYVENLTLTGTANNNAIGNALSNILIGTTGNNVLFGGGGADTMTGGRGDDTYYIDNAKDLVTELAGEGTDQVFSGVTFDGTRAGSAGIERVTLTGSRSVNVAGNALDNILIGNSGDNILNGGKGADTLIGGAGNDSYTIDNAGDVIIEQSGQGADTVKSAISFILSDNLENLTLVGTGALYGIGNAGVNVIVGGDGDNILAGRGEADTLTGGAGADVFDYNAVTESTSGASDRITDLTDADKIDLSGIDADTGRSGNQAFAQVSVLTGHAGQLTLIYDAASGSTVLSADVDGDAVADLRIVITGDHDGFTNFVF